MRRASQHIAAGANREAVDVLAGALTLLALDPAGASDIRMARVLRRLGDAQAEERKFEARLAYRRALHVLERCSDADEDTALELAAALTNLANLEPAVAEQYYGRAAELFERHCVVGATTVRDCTIALENRARLRSERGDHAGAADDLRRALDVAIGGLAVHGEELRDLVTSLELAVVKSFAKAKRWEEAAEIAREAAKRIEDGGADAKELRRLRLNAIRHATPDVVVGACGVCHAPDLEREAIIQGKLDSICDVCIEVGADDALPDSEVTAEPCSMCQLTSPRGGFVLDELRVCAACVARARSKVAEVFGSEKKVHWIADDVSRQKCAFCSKDRFEVRKLISGSPDTLICDECICLCNDILAEDPVDPRSPTSPFAKGYTCSFCRKGEGHRLITGPDVSICSACIDLCNQIIEQEVEDES